MIGQIMINNRNPRMTAAISGVLNNQYHEKKLTTDISIYICCPGEGWLWGIAKFRIIFTFNTFVDKQQRGHRLS